MVITNFSSSSHATIHKGQGHLRLFWQGSMYIKGKKISQKSWQPSLREGLQGGHCCTWMAHIAACCCGHQCRSRSGMARPLTLPPPGWDRGQLTPATWTHPGIQSPNQQGSKLPCGEHAVGSGYRTQPDSSYSWDSSQAHTQPVGIFPFRRSKEKLAQKNPEGNI